MVFPRGASGHCHRQSYRQDGLTAAADTVQAALHEACYQTDRHDMTAGARHL